MVPGPDRPRLRFGVFEVDPESGDVWKRGVRLRLHDKPFRVLQALLERPGSTITRKDLQERLWPGDTFVDFENGLNNAMSRLREALGDAAESPRFIETVPRRGYRFIGQVEHLAPATGVAPAAPLTPDETQLVAAPLAGTAPDAFPPPRRRRRWPWLLGAAGLATVLLVALTTWRTGAPVGPIRSLAVLPLSYEGPTAAPDQDYLAGGMTTTLITELSKIKGVRVISETSVQRYKNTTERLPKIARDLGVDAIVEGSVSREGNVVRVNVQLIQAATDTHLWAENYQRQIGSLMALQSDLALAIARQIDARLSPPEQSRLAARPQVNPDAFLHEARGRQLLSQRTEADLYAALDEFQAALAIDPSYASAYADIAETWVVMASWGTFVPPRTGFPKAKVAARSALELDVSLAAAHTVAAFVSEVYDWDMKAAEQSYLRALDLGPSYAPAHERYALYLRRTGKPVEGLEEMQRAYTLDPMSVDVNIGLGQFLFLGGRRDEGIAQIKRAIEIDPGYYDAYVHLAECYSHMKLPAEALAAAERGVALSHDSSHALQMLARVNVNAGRRSEAQSVLVRLEQHGKVRDAWELALLHLELGSKDVAIKWFQTACQERSPQLAFIQRIVGTSQFNPIRDDPRFQEVVRCSRLPS